MHWMVHEARKQALALEREGVNGTPNLLRDMGEEIDRLAAENAELTPALDSERGRRELADGYHDECEEENKRLTAENAALRGENTNLRTMLDTNAETMTRSVVEAGKENAALREKLAVSEKETWMAVQFLSCCQILAEGHEPDMVTRDSPACEAVRLLREKLAAASQYEAWYTELLAVIYEGADGINERPDPRIVVQNLQALYEEAAEKLAAAEAALRKIASCESRVAGDVVDIARRALPPAPGGERE